MEVLLAIANAPVGSAVASATLRVPQLSMATVALVASKKSGTGNLDVRIQHSPNELDWFDFVTFTQLVDASGTEEIAPTRAHFPYMRTVRTIGGTGVYDVAVYMDGIYGERRA